MCSRGGFLGGGGTTFFKRKIWAPPQKKKGEKGKKNQTKRREFMISTNTLSSRPVLVETFVNPTRFSGICYKASNWIEVGYTAGRRDGVQKKILVYALCKEWRDILCKKPEVKLGEKPRIENPAHWAEQEFGTIRLYDTRLKERLYTIAQDFYNRPQANIPEACGTKNRTIGSYRFFQKRKFRLF